MRVNPSYIQLIGDLLIPILGFLFWDWGLYFILLFILFDTITFEFFQHVKSYRIIHENKLSPRNWIIWGGVSFICFSVFLIILHFAIHFTIPSINFLTELWLFWSYEDVGIQQGYLLLPILLFSGYTNYKQTFLLTNQMKTLTLNQLWLPNMKQHVIRIGASVFWLCLASLVTLPITFWVLLVLLSTAAYRWMLLFWRTN